MLELTKKELYRTIERQAMVMKQYYLCLLNHNLVDARKLKKELDELANTLAFLQKQFEHRLESRDNEIKQIEKRLTYLQSLKPSEVSMIEFSNITKRLDELKRQG